MKKFITIALMALCAVSASAKQLYLCGDAPVGNGWGFGDANQVAMTLAADGITNTASIDVAGSPWFCVSEGGGSSWDDFNNNYRYSCSSFDGKVSGTYQLEKRGDFAMELFAGHYDISINSETMLMTLTYTPAAAPAENTYSVVGDTGLGLVWNPASTDIVMTKKSETLYELTRENITLSTGTNYYWRVLVNATTYGWSADRYGANGKNAGEGDDNIKSTFDEAGVYTLTFALDLSAGDASVPTVTAVKTGDIPRNYVYVNDQTGWNVLKLYAWGDGGDIFGSWGSTSVTDAETVVVNGVTYHKLSFLTGTGTAHLIFFNGDGDTGEGDSTRGLVDISLDKDHFVKVTSGSAVEEVSIKPAYELTTYVAPVDMDFTSITGLTAYKATSASSSSVHLDAVTTVLAGTPLVLKGTANETYDVPVAASASGIDDNLLVPGDGTTTIGGDSRFDYILVDGVFHRAKEGTVAVGKAYLHLTSAPARELTIEFDNTTAIDGLVPNTSSTVEGNIYDLQGRRVAQPTKGIYIMNGRKFVVK